ncbi:hypothetical protein HY991_01315 [Candidatus Micrarchaeota archaeon]|nr:hypothetical protein [Candidatus Micrarchaeota archaeon]
MEEGEFTVIVSHATSGKEIVVAVENAFTISAVLEVVAESLQLKDRHVLATQDKKILNPELTVGDAGLKEGDTLLLMPDPTGGNFSNIARE